LSFICPLPLSYGLTGLDSARSYPETTLPSNAA
jgi:hypothetical protein